MSESSREFEQAVLNLAWRHWTALGVSGWRLESQSTVSADSTAVDPEALIHITASLAEREPRLRDEATDWCIAYGRYVSKVRLKNQLRLDIADTQAFHSFAATVNRHAHLGWPDDGAQPRRFEPTGRSQLVVRGSSEALRMRARLIFGVSARAELLVLLATEQHWSSSASELAERVNYGRRNVVEALDALARTGLVREMDAPGGRRYALADPVALRAVLGRPPERFLDWGRAFKACWIALQTLRNFAGAATTVQIVEAVKAAERIESELMHFWLSPPRATPRGSTAWQRFGPWALDLVAMLKNPAAGEFAPRGRRRRSANRRFASSRRSRSGLR